MPLGKGIVHLFDFGDVAEVEIAESFRSSEWPTFEGFSTIDELMTVFTSMEIEVSSRQTVGNGGNALEMSANGGRSPLELARVLAGGYASGEIGRPVFPFIRLESSVSA